MVPFELTVLSAIFGQATHVAGRLRRGGELGEGYEDTWSLLMHLEQGAAGQLSVMGASPQTLRKGVAVGANGIVEFDFAEGVIIRKLPTPGIFDTCRFGAMREVLESVVYKKEIDTFIEAIRGHTVWPYDYRKASIVAGTLAAAEKSAITGKVEAVDPTLLPAEYPDQY